MTRTEYSIPLWGKDFDPLQMIADSGFTLQLVHPKGQVATSGRYRGQPLPYGAGNLVPADGLAGDEALLDLLSSYMQVKDRLKDWGVSDAHIDMAIYHDGQCNMEFPPEILRAIAASGLTLCQSVYEDDANSR